jgi:hypothetical protein
MASLTVPGSAGKEGLEEAVAMDPPAAGGRPPRADRHQVDADAFQAAFGEPLAHALDLHTWKPGDDFSLILTELRQQIGRSVEQEGRFYDAIRQVVFPKLATRTRAVPGAGVYCVTAEQLAQTHRGLLLNGGVEACDGTVSVHDALPLTIIRIGVCLVSYDGKQNKYSQQLFRRDLQLDDGEPVARLLAMLDRRRDRGGLDRNEQWDALSELSRRGIMTYAERAVLVQESKAIWRMGHGTPMPVELLSGSGSMELLQAGMAVVRELVEQHRRFVFVPSAPRERDWLTIGQALEPLQFAIVDSMQDRLQRIVDAAHYYGPFYRDLAQQFVDCVGPQIVFGLYRVWGAAPAGMFYAHVDHAAEAALVAMADSALQRHRGFPLLIDLADRWCQTQFGGDTLRSVAQEAYADVGAPFRYLAERAGRGKG